MRLPAQPGVDACDRRGNAKRRQANDAKVTCRLVRVVGQNWPRAVLFQLASVEELHRGVFARQHFEPDGLDDTNVLVRHRIAPRCESP